MSSVPNIAIVASCDRGYLPAACCLLKSVQDHLPSDATAQLFLVICDVSADDIREAERFFSKREMSVRIVVPDFVDRLIKPVQSRWPRAAYLRLYFDLLFDKTFDRVVYLDSDMRVRAPLAPLLEAELRGQPVGAVHDFIYYLSGNIRRCRRKLFLSDGSGYLQSGVMVFDWPKILAGDYLARARKFLSDYPDNCKEAPDQDALNAVLEGAWTPLDPRWNLHELYLTYRGHLTPYIEHYTSTKPWSKKRPRTWRHAAEWYRRELRDTAWAGFVEPQTLLDRFRTWLAYFGLHYSPKLRDAVADFAPFVLDWAGKPRQRDDNDILPWIPRRRADVERMADALVKEARRECPPLVRPESILETPL
jgi:lipopolysaccharide biosynthesis glycosyltransferase